jgi:hypothetical protein
MERHPCITAGSSSRINGPYRPIALHPRLQTGAPLQKRKTAEFRWITRFSFDFSAPDRRNRLSVENEYPFDADLTEERSQTLTAAHRRPRTAGPLSAALFVSLAINAAIAAVLYFIVISNFRPVPPQITATVAPEREPDRTIPEEELEKLKVAPMSGGAAMAADIVMLSAATSQIALQVPEVASLDNGMIDGFGFGSGFGSGNGSGNGFGPGIGEMSGSAKIGKLAVKALRLGVVLDTSGSMQDDLPKVKREIRRGFRDAETVEVVGCHLRLAGALLNPDASRKIKLRREAESVLEAIEMLVVEGRVDAIYWFSDLQDGEDESGLAKLAEVLRIEEARAGRSVKLYVRSLQMEPSEELRSIIKRSGGEIDVDAR